MRTASALSASIVRGAASIIGTQLRNVALSGAAQASEPDSAPADVPGSDHRRIKASMPV